MKKLSLFLTLLAATLFAQAQTIEQIYHFSQPVVSERDGYQQIGLQDCLPAGIVGEPTLPWQSVSLILPQGQEAVSINVEFFDFVELEGNFNLYPTKKRFLLPKMKLSIVLEMPIRRAASAMSIRNT